MLKSIFFRKKINTGRRIAAGFAALILVGAALLTLPIASRAGEWTSFLTALFTSTSATCVTGLSLVNVGEYFSLFGQIVLIMLIQIGGLGFMTILCLGFLLSKKRIGMRDRMLMAQNMGLESVEGIVSLAKRVLCITGVVEGIGAIVLAVRFVPRFGFIKGVWFGIFHSVSAFCNAGFDLIGDGRSMMSFANDPIVLITLALLIIIGGLGFIVWGELLRKRSWKKLSMYSKVVIIATAVLLVVGAAVFFAFEHKNPATLGGSMFGQKMLASFFQSATTRTAGFDAIGQSSMTEHSKILSIILMMIGGASGSTAGGVKVGTAVIVFISLFAVLRGKQDIVVFGRQIRHSSIIHALALMVMWLMLVVTGAVLISITDSEGVLESMYEVASAYSTVGLSVGVTEGASLFTKLLLILYMFFGRVGIMTISVVFMARASKKQKIRYPEGDFMIG